MTVRALDIIECIDSFAPWALAEEWDNVGLLAGDPSAQIRKVLCCLDLSRTVIDEALATGADMILAHHPVMFRGRKNLREDDPEGALLCRLIRGSLCFAAAHTNFDFADVGVNSVLAGRLGLSDIQKTEWGGRCGSIDPMPLGSFAEKVRNALGDAVRIYGNPEQTVSSAAVLGGSGGDFIADAAACGANVYVTGEIGYHKALDALGLNLCVLEAGHRATEAPSVPVLAELLRHACMRHGYPVTVNVSATALF